MNSLPPELHSLIIELASGSTFGANTTRAMSRTSTYFHAIASPFLFRTLAVSSQDQATQLLTLLEDTPVPKRHIHRLFLGPALNQSPAPALRLLHFAAPTLRDLAAILTSFSSALLGAVFRTPLPHLKTLAVRGFYPLPRPGAFPALTHLHLAGNHSPAGLLTAVARACPELTHLRVSSLRGATMFARELRGALEVEGAERVFPPRIEYVALEAQTPVHQAKLSDVAELRDAHMRKVLLELTESAAKREGAPRVEFSEEDADEVDADKMRIAWLEMVCP